LGKAALQAGIDVRVFGMRAQVISKGDVPGILFAARQADVEMMLNIVGRGFERVTSGDAKVAMMLVSKSCQLRDGGREVRVGSEKHV